FLFFHATSTLAICTLSLHDALPIYKVLDVDGDIVMPGLINTHTHASMTVFRSLADDVPDRLHRYIFPLENKMVSRDMVRVGANRSEEHTSELQSRFDLVCRLLLEKK